MGGFNLAHSLKERDIHTGKDSLGWHTHTERERERERALKVERKQIMADHETAGYLTKKIGAGILCI